MKPNILIVDDISRNIQVLGKILGGKGFVISFATDGIQALNMVSEQEFDLMLLDVMMPAMDGFEVCRQVRLLPDKKNLPIIFLTAKTEKNDIVRGLELGAVDYVTKPFNSHELLARVQTHLELKKARDLLNERNTELKSKNHRLQQLNKELQDALKKIKTLEGILPICSICKSIRDDKGYWNRVEAYFSESSGLEFTHSICPVCAQKHYPELDLFRDENE